MQYIAHFKALKFKADNMQAANDFIDSGDYYLQCDTLEEQKEEE